MTDQPICTEASPKPVAELERKAMEAYRCKYPNGIPCQELASETRVMWLRHIEQGDSNGNRVE